jgi:hypothetical protein
MRRLVLLLACLATAAAAAVAEPALPPPPVEDLENLETVQDAEDPQELDDTQYSPATQATLDWISNMEAQDAAEADRRPPGGPTPGVPSPDTLQGTGIQRCAGAEGAIVFTDRSCESVGAAPWTAPSSGSANTTIVVRTCARTRTALVDGLREALQTGDANRVASYYHWTGMGNRAAFALMERLHAFSQRPLVDVQLATGPDPVLAGPGAASGFWAFGRPGAERTKPRAPDWVRVDQMRGNKDAASEVTYFHLMSNAGCWWVHF